MIFTTGVYEIWHDCDISDHIMPIVRHYLPDDPYDGEDLILRNEFPYDPLGGNAETYEEFFLVSGSDYKRSNFASQRIICNELVHNIKENWRHLEYPHDILVEDYKRILEFDIDKHLYRNYLGILTCYDNRGVPGKYVMASLTNWVSRFDKRMSGGMRIMTAINKLLRRGKDVTRGSLLSALSVHINYISPTVYRKIIREFGLSGKSIADPRTDYGSKMIGCILEGCTYHCSKQHSRLAEFLNADVHPLDEDYYDAVFLDYSFKPSESIWKDLEVWKEKTDFLLVYIPKSIFGDIRSFWKPEISIPVEGGCMIPVMGFFCLLMP